MEGVSYIARPLPPSLVIVVSLKKVEHAMD